MLWSVYYKDSPNINYCVFIQHYIGDEDKKEYSVYLYITELYNREHKQQKKEFQTPYTLSVWRGDHLERKYGYR